jgi:hypothetical protein
MKHQQRILIYVLHPSFELKALKRPFKIFSEMLKLLIFENQTLRAVVATFETLDVSHLNLIWIRFCIANAIVTC